MKKIRITVIGAGFSLILLLFSPFISFVNADDAFNFRLAGGGGEDLIAIAVYGEYEMSLSDDFSFVGRVGYLNYEFDDDNFDEEGDGPGIEAGFRIYPRSNAIEGFFIGGVVGVWDTDWDWIDNKGRPSETRGSGSTLALHIGAEIGGKIPLGRRVYLIPAVQIGNWSGLDDECEPAGCDKETELGFYGAGSLGVGVVF